MKLILGEGIGEIKFGMLEADVLGIFGKPDQIKIDEDDDNKLIWIFNNEKTRLTFYKNEEGKLGYIETSSSQVIFNDEQVIGSNIQTVKKEVFGKSIFDWEVDDYHSFITYFNEENWITLHVEYEEVKDIELGIPFDDDNDYNWKIIKE